MGLIIFGAILVGLYLTKLIFPEFVVKVAEVEGIVKVGTYIDTHEWAYYSINCITSFAIMYFYSCACCRTKKLNYRDTIVVLFMVILGLAIEKYVNEFSFVYNNTLYLTLPLVLVLLNKLNNFKIFYSTAVCFVISSFAQVLSLYIRDIGMMVSCFNTATYFVLLIDLYIWTGLLYLFYNYKRRD